MLQLSRFLIALPAARAALIGSAFHYSRRRWTCVSALDLSLSVPSAELKHEAKEDRNAKFLIRNDRNDVQLLQCPSIPMVEQGRLELGDLPQICVAGESNAGKSSMINHLLRKKLARASSVAGKTRSVDMMRVNNRLVVTDLPGLPSRDHQVARIWESEWRPLVMHYLHNSPSLRAMIYTHDIRWKVSRQVVDFLREVEQAGVPVLLVLTKDDRLEGNAKRSPHDERLTLTARIRRSLRFEGVHVHYSVDNDLPASRASRRTLLRYIEQLVAAENREECADILATLAAKKQRGGPPGRA